MNRALRIKLFYNDQCECGKTQRYNGCVFGVLEIILIMKSLVKLMCDVLFSNDDSFLAQSKRSKRTG